MQSPFGVKCPAARDCIPLPAIGEALSHLKHAVAVCPFAVKRLSLLLLSSTCTTVCAPQSHMHVGGNKKVWKKMIEYVVVGIG
jgi:hypothetical protein